MVRSHDQPWTCPICKSESCTCTSDGRRVTSLDPAPEHMALARALTAALLHDQATRRWP